MAERRVLELSAPVLGRHTVTDLHIESVSANESGRGWFLQTSPEYALKRALAAGVPSLYSMGPVFRAGESGARHNPEFTMLEWYRVGFSVGQLMDEVGLLLQDLGVEEPMPRLAYGELFASAFGIDPHQAAYAVLRELVASRLPDVNLPSVTGIGERADRNTCLDLLFTRFIEPGLTGFVFDYPASQSALAEVTVDGDGRTVANRFELFLDGVELANGYQELRDAEVLRGPMALDQEERAAAGRPAVEQDDRLLAAMTGGLPVCAGVALGVERLLMALSGAASIHEVMAFPADRA